MSSFKELLVWKIAHAFVLRVYRITKNYPIEEKFGLTNQFRRAAVSVPANIAEGYRKYSPKEKLHYVNIAHCSLEECRYFLILSEDLGYNKSNVEEMSLLEEVSKLLTLYKRSIK